MSPLYTAQLPRFVPLQSLVTCAPPFTAGLAAGIISLASTGGTWPSNNRAIYQQFCIDLPCTIKKIGVEVSTQSGNCDVGIYNENFTRLVSAGSTAVAAAGIQIFDITDTVLTPGLYYAAMNCSTTAAAFFRSQLNSLVCRGMGVAMEDVGAVALPATATPVAMASSYLPWMALGMGTIL